MYIPTVHDKFFALKIEIQYNMLKKNFFFFQGEIWNLDHLVTCGIPYANTYGIPRNSGQFYCKKDRGIPRNFAEFRMFFKKFRIPSEVKNPLPWTPYMSHCAFVSLHTSYLILNHFQDIITREMWRVINSHQIKYHRIYIICPLCKMCCQTSRQEEYRGVNNERWNCFPFSPPSV
jgi:hypothetical protein